MFFPTFSPRETVNDSCQKLWSSLLPSPVTSLCDPLTLLSIFHTMAAPSAWITLLEDIHVACTLIILGLLLKWTLLATLTENNKQILPSRPYMPLLLCVYLVNYCLQTPLGQALKNCQATNSVWYTYLRYLVFVEQMNRKGNQECWYSKGLTEGEWHLGWSVKKCVFYREKREGKGCRWKAQ